MIGMINGCRRKIGQDRKEPRRKAKISISAIVLWLPVEAEREREGLGVGDSRCKVLYIG